MGESDSDAITVRMPCVVSASPRGSSPGFVIGNGTEQHESTMMLGRPVMILRILSSEYKLHQVCTNVSRFDAFAEGSSFRTWRPRE